MISHGLTRYRKGCHCDVCRSASAERSRRYRRARREREIAATGIAYPCMYCGERFAMLLSRAVHEGKCTMA